MALIGRENGLKIIALVVVALFMFELFAYYGSAPAQPTDDGTLPTGPSAPVAGAAIIEATVLSYSTELAIANENAAANAVIKQLEDSGQVQYKARRSDGVLVLNFAKRTNMSEIAVLFAGTNATLGASARLRAPTLINFTTANGALLAVFQDVNVEISPDVPVGQNVTLRINANIVDGAVASYVAVPVAIKKQFTVEAEVLGYEPGHIAVFESAWESRSVDYDNLRIEFYTRFPTGTLTLLRNDSVLVELGGANFSQEYVAQAHADRLDIDPAFMDSRRIQDDLLSAGVQSPAYFPPTRVAMEVDGDEIDFSFVAPFMNYSNFDDYRGARVALPETVEADGVNYTVKQREVLVPLSSVPVGTVVNVTLEGSVFAGSMINIRVPDPQ